MELSGNYILFVLFQASCSPPRSKPPRSSLTTRLSSFQATWSNRPQLLLLYTILVILYTILNRVILVILYTSINILRHSSTSPWPPPPGHHWACLCPRMILMQWSLTPSTRTNIWASVSQNSFLSTPPTSTTTAGDTLCSDVSRIFIYLFTLYYGNWKRFSGNK